MSTDPADQTIYARRLVPHRSLSERNFRLLLTIFSAICIVASLPFFLLGAWPVVGFMGFDILLLYTAFRLNFRAARAYEDVRVTPIELRLAKVTSAGERSEWRFHPAWVRLHSDVHEDFGVERLALISRGASVEVASFLGREEKSLFAKDLSRALAEARRGPRF